MQKHCSRLIHKYPNIPSHFKRVPLNIYPTLIKFSTQSGGKLSTPEIIFIQNQSFQPIAINNHLSRFPEYDR